MPSRFKNDECVDFNRSSGQHVTKQDTATNPISDKRHNSESATDQLIRYNRIANQSRVFIPQQMAC